MKKLIILGSGGHGQVIAETAKVLDIWSEISFLDDNPINKKILDFNVIGKMLDFEKFNEDYTDAFVAVGNNELRHLFLLKLKDSGYEIPSIIHPTANVSEYAIIGKGAAVLAGAVVNTNCEIGNGCIINVNSIVDHDSKIGHSVHISSGAIVRSNVKIGNYSLIGAGSFISSNHRVHEKYILGDFKSLIE